MTSRTKINLLKLVTLATLIASAIYFIHVKGWGMELFSLQHIEEVVKGLGPWAPLAYVITYAAAVMLTFPATVITVAGATVFGLLEAYLLVLVGACTGAALSFGIGRFLGQSGVDEFLEGQEDGVLSKLAQARSRFGDNGIIVVAYLRMIYVPFVVLNYLAPLTNIRFRDFMAGTFLGILPGSFVFVFLGNTIRDAWRMQDLSLLWGWQSAVALGLFLTSLVLPHVIQRVAFSKE